MPGTNAIPLQRAEQSTVPVRAGIYLKWAKLDELLTREGLTKLRQRARHLGCGVATLDRARKGETPVSSDFIFAVRTTFPEVPYERLFGEEVGDEHRAA